MAYKFKKNLISIKKIKFYNSKNFNKINNKK